MRLIDADALWDKVLEHVKDGDVIYSIPPDFIDKAPTVDAEIVRHGRWVFDNDGGTHCSYCGQSVKVNANKEYLIPVNSSAMPFCPKCGAKMDGGGDEK